MTPLHLYSMTEDLEMKGSDPILPPCGCVPSGLCSEPTPNEPPDESAYTSGPRIEDREPATLTSQNDSREASESNANTTVITPYAIEEPDDDDSAVQLEWPCLPDNFERWQRDLVDYMHRLDYDPSPEAPPKQARGQKRKSGISAGIGHHHPLQSSSPCPTTRSDTAQSMASGLGPKRRRRRRKLPPEDAKAARSACSLNHFRERQSSGSSSSEMRSTDTSSAETMNESATADAMDID